MANTGSIGTIKYVEQWLTDNVNTAAADGVMWVYTADGGTAPVRAVAAGKGIHLTTVMAATNDHMHELCTDELITYGQDGYNSVEFLFMVSSIADLAFNVGFNDDSLEASDTLPAELATATWTSNAATFVGLVYDVDATNDEVHCFWVDDDNDASTAIASLRMNGAVPVANKWMMARVSLQDQGSGNGVRATFTFGVDGKSFEKVFNTSVDRDAALCPYIAFENRDATAHTVYIKYIALEQSISD